MDKWEASVERWKTVEAAPEYKAFADGRMATLKLCLADLLAILTEPQNEEVQKDQEKCDSSRAGEPESHATAAGYRADPTGESEG